MEQSIPLSYGDCIYLYTDGVNEAMNEQEELFGRQRLEEVLNGDEDLYKDPEGMLKKIYQTLDAYRGTAEQFDDITMVYLSRIG